MPVRSRISTDVCTLLYPQRKILTVSSLADDLFSGVAPAVQSYVNIWYVLLTCAVQEVSATDFLEFLF